MSIEQPTTFRMTGVRKLVLAAIVVLILGLQLGLPLTSYSLGRNGLLFRADRLPTGDSFARQRLRFQGLIDPRSLLPPLGQFASCAVGVNELYLLLTPMKDPLTNDLPNELVQFNRHTGRVKTLRPPVGVRYVVSDGTTVWWLPGDESITSPYISLTDPFLLDGQPVAIKLDSSQRSPCLHRIVECVDGHWQDENQFALAPCIFEPRFMMHSDIVQHADRFAFVLRFSNNDIFYRRDLQTGTLLQATLFAQRYGFPTTEHLRDSGWTQIHLEDGLEAAGPIPPRSRRPLGMWIEDQHPCAITVSASDLNSNRTYLNGFDVTRFFRDGKHQTSFVPSPIKWQSQSNERGDKGWIHVVAGRDGEAFLICCDGLDGRLHLLRWDGEDLKLVGSRRSPLFGAICLDSGLFALLTFVVPMLVLGLFARFWQRRQGPREHTCGMQTLALSTAVRRGFARLIDLMVPASLLVVPLLIQIDAIGWWLQMHRQIDAMIDQANVFADNPSWDSLDHFWPTVSAVLRVLLSIPVPWWLLTAALLTIISHIVWQGISGRTIGKWLMGIKVLRTTHRRCGFARSLLREILFVLESMLLLSCVPAVISILSTQRWQRIGDLLADTIVIRDMSAPKFHVNEPNG